MPKSRTISTRKSSEADSIVSSADQLLLRSVERVLHYAHKLEREAPPVIEDARPPPEWPAGGAIDFKNVVMSYRPDLPPVLKGLSLNIGAGEKVGVVGRTGAGKSSIMQTLFRVVELTSGSIEVDGIDISKIGLADLRKKIAIIPQDALLFNGTIRTNLDPFSEHQDAELYDALKRAWLVDQDQAPPAAEAGARDAAGSTPKSSRFTLDTVVEDEGGNLSVGERSLVSLARALVKDSKIIVLECVTSKSRCASFADLPRSCSQRSDCFGRFRHRLAHPVDDPQRVQGQDGALHDFSLQTAPALTCLLSSPAPRHRSSSAHHHRLGPRARHGRRRRRRVRHAAQSVPRARHFPRHVRAQRHHRGRHFVDDFLGVRLGRRRVSLESIASFLLPL